MSLSLRYERLRATNPSRGAVELDDGYAELVPVEMDIPVFSGRTEISVQKNPIGYEMRLPSAAIDALLRLGDFRLDLWVRNSVADPADPSAAWIRYVFPVADVRLRRFEWTFPFNANFDIEGYVWFPLGRGGTVRADGREFVHDGFGLFFFTDHGPDWTPPLRLPVLSV